MPRFLGSLRARLMLLHPSPNCSLRAESLVHVHFKEEIGVAELIPLVTTYIILFAYIYFSTRRLQQGGRAFPDPVAFPDHGLPCPWGRLGQRCRTCPVVTKARLPAPGESQARGSSDFSGKEPSRMGASRDTVSLRPGGGHGCPFLGSHQGPSLPRQAHPAPSSSAQGLGCRVGRAPP